MGEGKYTVRERRCCKSVATKEKQRAKALNQINWLTHCLHLHLHELTNSRCFIITAAGMIAPRERQDKDMPAYAVVGLAFVKSGTIHIFFTRGRIKRHGFVPCVRVSRRRLLVL
jgi:hypothetical protein